MIYFVQAVVIDYTNWRGERAERLIDPAPVPPYFTSTEHHPEPQWLMDAVDVAKDAVRTFALKDIHSWRPATAEDFARLAPSPAPEADPCSP